MNSRCIQICWSLGYTIPETFDKTNDIVYWLLMGTTIHMFSESWIRQIDSPM
jgi:hypothetical protein